MPRFVNNLFIGSQGADVTELQNILRTKGYFTVASTGYFGPVTSAALVKYQQAKGLPATGILDAATRAALNSEVGLPAVLGASIDRTALLAQIASLQAMVQQLMAVLAQRRAQGI